MRYDSWDALMDSLTSWTTAREVPGGIEVVYSAPSGTQRAVEIVMTRDDWEEMAGVIGAESPETVKRHLLALAEDEHFLVCDAGVELVPSPTRELPPDPLDDFVPEPGGEWVATDAEGNVVSRFAESDDEQR